MLWTKSASRSEDARPVHSVQKKTQVSSDCQKDGVYASMNSDAVPMTATAKSYDFRLGDLLPDRAAAADGVGADLFSVGEHGDDQRAAVAVALLE